MKPNVWLIVCPVAVLAFGAGYQQRALMDKSEIVELQRQVDEGKKVAADWEVTTNEAQDRAAISQNKVDAYVATIKQTPPCGFTPEDVDRLLGSDALK
jgi:hypothetical protein